MNLIQSRLIQILRVAFPEHRISEGMLPPGADELCWAVKCEPGSDHFNRLSQVAGRELRAAIDEARRPLLAQIAKWEESALTIPKP